jgi:hypothetical protein
VSPADQIADGIAHLNIDATLLHELVQGLEEVFRQQEGPSVKGIPANEVFADALDTAGAINRDLSCLVCPMVWYRREVYT